MSCVTCRSPYETQLIWTVAYGGLLSLYELREVQITYKTQLICTVAYWESLSLYELGEVQITL